jgi:hypothetical protein
MQLGLWWKLDMTNSIIATIWTHVFELFVIRLGFKNKHWEGICSKEIGLCAQKYVYHYKFNNQYGCFFFGRGGPIWAINEHEIDHEENIQMSSKNYRENGNKHDLDMRIISHSFSSPSKKQVQREKYPNNTCRLPWQKLANKLPSVRDKKQFDQTSLVPTNTPRSLGVHLS